MTDDPVGFGGGDEDGLLCGCGRRVRTPFCPWCGRRLDDAGAQLLAYLEHNAAQNEKTAATKREKGRRYPGHEWERTVERTEAKARQQREWAAWVRERIEESRCTETTRNPDDT